MLSSETHRPRRQRADGFFRVHRCEPVTTESGQPCCQGARLVATRPTRSSADVEVEIVAHDQESAARGLDIVGVPVALLVGHGAKCPSIRPGPMPSVPAVAQHDVVWFVTVGGLAAPDGEEPDDHAFVGDGVEVVELGLDFEIIALRVEAIHVRPAHRLIYLPSSGSKNVRTFLVRAFPRKTVAPVNRISDLIDMADAINPDLAERVPEDSASVHHSAALGERVAPMNAIRREMDRHDPIVPFGHWIRCTSANHAKHLETSRRILLLQIKPYRARVPSARLDDVGLWLHIKGRFFPLDAVTGGGVGGGGALSDHVPHLEKLVLRVVPDAVAEYHCGGMIRVLHLPGSVRFEDGTCRMVLGEV